MQLEGHQRKSEKHAATEELAAANTKELTKSKLKMEASHLARVAEVWQGWTAHLEELNAAWLDPSTQKDKLGAMVDCHKERLEMVEHKHVL